VRVFSSSSRLMETPVFGDSNLCDENAQCRKWMNHSCKSMDDGRAVWKSRTCGVIDDDQRKAEKIKRNPNDQKKWMANPQDQISGRRPIPGRSGKAS
jgi:hypothetical protein